MLESVAVMVLVLLAVVLVLAKARERLGAPGARRSRRGEVPPAGEDRRWPGSGTDA
jgi:hypothetical protein